MVGDICTADGVVDGEPAAVVALLRHVAAVWIVRTLVPQSGLIGASVGAVSSGDSAAVGGASSGDGLTTAFEIIVAWTSVRIETSGLVCNALTHQAFQDGRALLAVLSYHDSRECPFVAGPSTHDNLSRALEDAQRLYDVAPLLDPTEGTQLDEYPYTCPSLHKFTRPNPPNPTNPTQPLPHPEPSPRRVNDRHAAARRVYDRAHACLAK